MSRVGKKPIPVPAGVNVTVSEGEVTAKGPLGQLSYRLLPGMELRQEDGTVVVVDTNASAESQARSALHGVSRAMVANLVTGVSSGFRKGLEIVGTGYRATLSGRTLEISVGFNQPIKVPLPDGVTAEVADKPPRIVIKGIRKDLVGQVAADIRHIREPEPYLGKGIRYEGEQVRRKAGKSAG